MKLSTTQDRAYLKECLAFHTLRRAQCANTGDVLGVGYHRKQVKWFEAKLRSPIIGTPNLASATETQTRFESEEHQRYIERLDLYKSQIQTDEATPEPAPRKGFFTRMIDLFRG